MKGGQGLCNKDCDSIVGIRHRATDQQMPIGKISADRARQDGETYADPIRLVAFLDFEAR